MMLRLTYVIPGENGMDMVKDYIPIDNKKAVIKTDTIW
jgi:hypothetical protein